MVYVPRMKNLKKLVPNVNPNLCKNAYWRFTPVDINLLVNFFGSLLLVVVMLSVNKLCTKKRTLLLLSINVGFGISVPIKYKMLGVAGKQQVPHPIMHEKEDYC